MENKLISVIVPVYNAEKYLKHCVNSIVHQSYKNIEILLIDDGSTDSSGKICDQFQKSDQRIRVIHKKNGGANAARKTGIQNAHGEYIGFVDSDDWLELNMYYDMYNAIKENPKVDIVICDYVEEYQERQIYVHLKENGLIEAERLNRLYDTMIYNGNFFGSDINGALWNKLFKKEIIHKHILESIDDLTIGEDSAILYPSILKAKSMYFLNKKGYYHYRIRQGSVSLSYKPKLFINSKKWFQWMLQYCNAKDNINIEKEIEGYFACLGIASIVNEYRRKGKIDHCERYSNLKKIIYDKDMKKIVKELDVSKYKIRDKIFIWLVKKSKIKTIDVLLRVKERNNARVNKCNYSCL